MPDARQTAKRLKEEVDSAHLAYLEASHRLNALIAEGRLALYNRNYRGRMRRAREQFTQALHAHTLAVGRFNEFIRTGKPPV